MKTRSLMIMITLIAFFLFGASTAYSGQKAKAAKTGSKGYLELECNLAEVDLYACPRDQFERKKIRKFFGLGTTPLEPIELPEGGYVLRIPPDYVWERPGQIEVSVSARQKTFFLLKLFKRHSAQVGGPGDSPGASGGSAGGGSGSGGGSGTGGAPGSPPP